MVLFHYSQFYSIGLFFIPFVPVLHFFDYCAFVVNFEIGKYESSNFVFHF